MTIEMLEDVAMDVLKNQILADNPSILDPCNPADKDHPQKHQGKDIPVLE